MFKKLLIANRGEIACRIIKATRKLGIKSVAIFSEADRQALHVASADEAICVGPAPSSKSYLAQDNIIAACQSSGAEAIHPGYGFLSENSEFVEKLAATNIAFIGPTASAIRSMGDKITSKRLAKEAGVSTIPGHTEVVADAQEAVAIAKDIGYPVMIKASAGGGGKGMRIAHNDAECRDGFERATSEAGSSFGDDRVFLERYIENPRHIEIQVLADTLGNCVHLFERECSLQRRHQKIIEESPSPLLDDALRQAMGEQAIALAQAVDYQSAGTVEFVVDQSNKFYFLEMNTRLQVEHPVTEYVSGLDLVEWMIRIAAGEKLSFQQSDLQINGWAVEARIYAEDPRRNFLPSIGRINTYQPPQESETVRVDTGISEGDEISIHYDPMIAKLITFGETRAQSIAEMKTALNRFHIDGVNHNVNFLAAIVDHPEFLAGDLSTNFIQDHFPEGFNPSDKSPANPNTMVAIAAGIHSRYQNRMASLSSPPSEASQRCEHNWVAVLSDNSQVVNVYTYSDVTDFEVSIDGKTVCVETTWQFGQPVFHGTVDGEEINLLLERNNLGYRLWHNGSECTISILTPTAASLLDIMPVKQAADTSRFLLSPMPGLLSQLLVEAGQSTKADQPLAIVEAMKMENVLRAQRDATVAKVLAKVGDTLEVDQPILEFTSE